MQTPNLDTLASNLKTVAECRALIVLNGMGKKTPTDEELTKAFMTCAISDPHIDAPEDADWRLFIASIPEGFDDNNLPEPVPAIHVHAWMVNTIGLFVTDDELDNIMGDTPCTAWIFGLTELAESLPAEYRREETIAHCRKLEEAGRTISDEKITWLNASLKLKADAVRAARLVGREEPEKKGPEIMVAIIGE